MRIIIFKALDRFLGALARSAAWLAIPVVVALFLQWPLRDWVQCCSREVNDLAQWLFALYIAISVPAATRAHTHLRADALSKTYAPRTRVRLTIVGIVAVLLPFAFIIGVMSWPAAQGSLVMAERFPDTLNPGYFVIKLAVPLMTLILALQACVDLLRPEGVQA